MQRIKVVTDIAASQETVWAELTALGAYADWNPFITMAEGNLVQGAHLKVRIAPPGGRAMTFRPKVTEVVMGERLEWLGRLLVPGAFDGRHSFGLEVLGDGRTRLTQAEEFSGLLVAASGKVLARTRAGFEAMNEALRMRAEHADATQTA